MQEALHLTRLNLTRFDRIILGILLAIAFLTALLIWRGDRVGVQVVGVSPPDGATGVSTKTDIRVTFDQPMVVAASDLPLNFSPPVSGTTRWEESSLVFSPDAPLNADTTYKVNLTAELQSQQGRSLKTLPDWQFHTRQSHLLYVAPDANALDQIFSIDPAGGSPVQLTQEAFGVFDYALSSDAVAIAYSALREDGGSDLWTIGPDGGNRKSLLLCPEAVCSGVAWAPHDARLIYERRSMLVPGAAPGPPRLWWLSLVDGQTVAVFDDTQILGYGASWSPDGRWLSYIAPASQGIQVYNINDGRSLVIPSRIGGLAVWSPQSDSLLASDIQPINEGFSVHLLRANIEGGELVDISGQAEAVEDSSPVWSPDGSWIALTRKAAGASMGKQIWLMRPDGSEARYLTSEPDIHHGLPVWSPDGRYLAFQRFLLKEIGARPSIWLMELKTEQMRELVTPGNRPVWLP